jgi:hypothetical protein
MNGVCDVPLSPTAQQVGNQLNQDLSNQSICSVLLAGSGWVGVGTGALTGYNYAANYLGYTTLGIFALGPASWLQAGVIKVGCSIATGSL